MKENSIEEDIKKALDKFSDNKDSNSAVLIVEKFILGNYVLVGDRKNIVKDSLRYILSDYKRVLKENEELKQEKINNYRMIALAQNEALGYMQGYEDGKKLKTSAIASIVENQQYYIIKKQMEKYEEHIAKLQKENEELKNAVNVVNKEKADWIRAYQEEKDKQFELLRSNIPIQKVKDKIEELKKQYNVRELDFIKTTQDIRKIIIQSLEELLEGRK